MAIVEPKTKGVVLSGRFDKSSPTLAGEVREFEVKLAALQKRLGFREFVHRTRTRGSIVEVDVVPAQRPERPKPAVPESGFVRGGAGDWMRSIGASSRPPTAR